MRPLRYSINVTWTGAAIIVNGSRTKTCIVTRSRNLAQADALLFGRVTYEMMEAAWRLAGADGAMPDWTEPFARTIDAAKKYVVSSTLDRVDWNAELVRGDLGRPFSSSSGSRVRDCSRGGVKLPLALAELGLIDEYEFVVHPQASRATGRRCSRAIEACRLEAREPAGVRLGGGGDAV
jgi:dihydrofolate reductase